MTRYLEIHHFGSKSLTTENPNAAFLSWFYGHRIGFSTLSNIWVEDIGVKIIGLWGLSRMNFPDLSYLGAVPRHLRSCCSNIGAESNWACHRRPINVCAVCSLSSHRDFFFLKIQNAFKESWIQSRALCVTKTGRMFLIVLKPKTTRPIKSYLSQAGTGILPRCIRHHDWKGNENVKDFILKKAIHCVCYACLNFPPQTLQMLKEWVLVCGQDCDPG